MGRNKTAMPIEFIKNQKLRDKTFHKRKLSLKKKLHEFKTLCGVDTCMIVYGPGQNEDCKAGSSRVALDVFPSDPNEVNEVIKKYKSRVRQSPDEITAGRNLNLSDYYQNLARKVEDDILRTRRAAYKAKYSGFDARLLDGCSADQLMEILNLVDRKYERVQLLSQLIAEENQRARLEAGNGMIGYTYDAMPQSAEENQQSRFAANSGMIGYNAIPQFVEENQLSRFASNSGTIVYNAMPQNNYYVDHNVYQQHGVNMQQQQPEQYHNYHQFDVDAFDQFSSFNRCAEGLPYYMPPASYCDLTSSGFLEAMIGNNFDQTMSYGIKEESMLAPMNPGQANLADVNGSVYNFGDLPSLNPNESGMYYRC